jgi:hypothetical protein
MNMERQIDMNKTRFLLYIFSVLVFSFLLFFASPKTVYAAFRFVAWADTKSARSQLAELSNMIVNNNLNPVFTIYPGDLESDGPTCAGLKAWKNAMNGERNNGIWDITFPTRGNHDRRPDVNYSGYCSSGVNIQHWKDHFDLKNNAQKAGVSNYVEDKEDLRYSFEYGNSIFIGLDVAGGITWLTAEDKTFLSSRLSNAESRGLTHAFIYFHGPIYCIDGHCSCSDLTGCMKNASLDLVKIFNQHPIVSATFHGHEHIYAYTYMNKSRASSITNDFHQFVVGSAGAGPDSCSKTKRFEYCMPNDGFTTVDVNGSTFSVSFYKIGNSSPVKTYNCAKNGSCSTGPAPTSGPTVTPGPTNTPAPTTQPGVPGDANGDDRVDISDFVVLLNNYKQSKQGVQFGDFNENGKVDGLDYIVWLLNYGKW